MLPEPKYTESGWHNRVEKSLAALIVSELNQQFGVRCAERYFLVQHLMTHSGNIETETLAAMVVFIQDAPIHSATRVLAATTV
eukprot:1222-Karenia_brevis.AAC.1